ncbi:MAG: DUF5317 domain-containing protein [Chloroflexi bacterium]|nr:DUF5317 domain-containing protein [Chloroflexota bacterium]
MLLLFALAAGLLVGLGRAGWQHRSYQPPALRSAWLAFAAFFPQLVVAYLPATRYLLADWLASIVLVISLILFAVFAWRNRHLPGMPILLAGLALNLIVIAANGGWMPISPQTASRLTGNDVLRLMSLGSRFGQKDILLLAQNTRFEFLADRFLLPDWIPYRVAFSLGDVLVGFGIFWLLAFPSVSVKAIPPGERVHLDYI